MPKVQAERCSIPQAKLHSARQQCLGERMLGDHDNPRRIELLITGLVLVIVVCIGYAKYKGWL